MNLRESNSPRLASWALERIAERLGVRIEKSLDPLDPNDFVTISARLASALRGAVRGAEAAALKAALDSLDVDWPSLTAAQRSSIITVARDEVARATAAAAPAVSEVFERSATSIIETTRQATIARFGLVIPEPVSADRITADIMRRSQMVYVKDEFGRRADALDARARQIVASGLERGLGRDDISEELQLGLSEQQVNRSRAYWDVVANDFANKSRTATQLSAFDDAGIATYEFVAVMDEVTSSICRMMHGTTWAVSAVLDQVEQALDLEDPEDIRDARPWVRNGVDDDGREVLYFDKGGERRVVAQVSSNGFKREMSDADLLAAGVTLPPLHGRCRSTVVAV